jgi:C4-dicarboxylate-specific signal transduction histidine kinase
MTRIAPPLPDKHHLSLTEGIIGAVLDVSELKATERKLTEYIHEIDVMNDELELRVQEEVEKNLKKELQLLESAKLASMGAMLGNIIHQWKQPLSAISAMSAKIQMQLSLSDTIDKDELFNDTAKISQLVQRLAEITVTFRNFMKATKQVERSRLQSILKNALNISGTVLTDRSIRIIEEISPEPLTITTVASELMEVIINNAADILTERKIIDPWVKVCLFEQGGIKVITIEDHAGGIDDDILPHIFDEYFTTKSDDKGTGLGLYMSKKIVEESLSGELHVKNTPEGARFIIRLNDVEQA